MLCNRIKVCYQRKDFCPIPIAHLFFFFKSCYLLLLIFNFGTKLTKDYTVWEVFSLIVNRPLTNFENSNLACKLTCTFPYCFESIIGLLDL